MNIALGFNEFQQQSKILAAHLKLPYEEVKIHHFPDGESKITLPQNLPEHIIICRSLNHPNDKLVELLIAADAARVAGVKHITLVAPYLCYMRQDIAFHPGEAVSQKIIGKILAQHFDALFTIDPHLHRIKTLPEAVPLKEAIALTATHPMSDFLQTHFNNPVIVGPDAESVQWVAEICEQNHWQYQVASKQRLGDSDVKVTLPEFSYENRDVVIVDDIASTGKTIEGAAKIIQQFRPASLSVLVTHAFFVDKAIADIQALGVKNIWSSDAIAHVTNAFSVMPHIADSIKAHHLL